MAMPKILACKLGRGGRWPCQTLKIPLTHYRLVLLLLQISNRRWTGLDGRSGPVIVQLALVVGV